MGLEVDFGPRRRLKERFALLVESAKKVYERVMIKAPQVFKLVGEGELRRESLVETRWTDSLGRSGTSFTADGDRNWFYGSWEPNVDKQAVMKEGRAALINASYNYEPAGISAKELAGFLRLAEEREKKGEDFPVDRNNEEGKMARRILRDLALNRLGNYYGLSSIADKNEEVYGMVKKSALKGICSRYLDKSQLNMEALVENAKRVVTLQAEGKFEEAENVTKGAVSIRGSEYLMYELDEVIADWKYSYALQIDAPGDIKKAITEGVGNPDNKRGGYYDLAMLMIMTTVRERVEDPAAPGKIYDEAFYMSRLITNDDLSDPKGGYFKGRYFIPDPIVRQRIMDLRNLGGVNLNLEIKNKAYPAVIEGMTRETMTAYMTTYLDGLSDDEKKILEAEILTTEEQLRVLGIPDAGRVSRSIMLRVMLMGGKVNSGRMGRPILSKDGSRIRVCYPALSLFEFWLLRGRHAAFKAPGGEDEDSETTYGFGVMGWYNRVIRKAYESRRWMLFNRISPTSLLVGTEDMIERDVQGLASPAVLSLSSLFKSGEDSVQGMLQYQFDASPDLWDYSGLYLGSGFCESRAVELAGLPTRYEVVNTLRDWICLRLFGFEGRGLGTEMAQFAAALKGRGGRGAKTMLEFVARDGAGATYHRMFEAIGEWVNSWMRIGERKGKTFTEKPEDMGRGLTSWFLFHFTKRELHDLLVHKYAGCRVDMLVGREAGDLTSEAYFDRLKQVAEEMGLWGDERLGLTDELFQKLRTEELNFGDLEVPLRTWSPDHVYNLALSLSLEPRPEERMEIVGVSEREILRKIRFFYWVGGDVQSPDGWKWLSENRVLTVEELSYLNKENWTRLKAILDREKDLVWIKHHEARLAMALGGIVVVRKIRANRLMGLADEEGFSNEERWIWNLIHGAKEKGKRDERKGMLWRVMRGLAEGDDMKYLSDGSRPRSVNEREMWQRKVGLSERAKVNRVNGKTSTEGFNEQELKQWQDWMSLHGATDVFWDVMENRFGGNEDREGLHPNYNATYDRFLYDRAILERVLKDELFKLVVFGAKAPEGMTTTGDDPLALEYPRLNMQAYEYWSKCINWIALKDIGVLEAWNEERQEWGYRENPLAVGGRIIRDNQTQMGIINKRHYLYVGEGTGAYFALKALQQSRKKMRYQYGMEFKGKKITSWNPEKGEYGDPAQAWVQGDGFGFGRDPFRFDWLEYLSREDHITGALYYLARRDRNVLKDMFLFKGLRRKLMYSYWPDDLTGEFGEGGFLGFYEGKRDGWLTIAQKGHYPWHSIRHVKRVARYVPDVPRILRPLWTTETGYMFLKDFFWVKDIQKGQAPTQEQFFEWYGEGLKAIPLVGEALTTVSRPMRELVNLPTVAIGGSVGLVAAGVLGGSLLLNGLVTVPLGIIGLRLIGWVGGEWAREAGHVGDYLGDVSKDEEGDFKDKWSRTLEGSGS